MSNQVASSSIVLSVRRRAVSIRIQTLTIRPSLLATCGNEMRWASPLISGDSFHCQFTGCKQAWTTLKHSRKSTLRGEIEGLLRVLVRALSPCYAILCFAGRKKPVILKQLQFIAARSVLVF